MRTAEIKGGKPSDVLMNRYKQAVCSSVDRNLISIHMLPEDISLISREQAQRAGDVVSIYAISRITRNTPPQVDTPTCKNISRTELLFYCRPTLSIETATPYIVKAFAADISAQESESWYRQRYLAIENVQMCRCLDDMYSGCVVCQARKTSVVRAAEEKQKKKEEDPRKKPEKQKPDKKDDKGSRRVKRPKV